jgi:hypothetical protein
MTRYQPPALQGELSSRFSEPAALQALARALARLRYVPRCRRHWCTFDRYPARQGRLSSIEALRYEERPGATTRVDLDQGTGARRRLKLGQS